MIKTQDCSIIDDSEDKGAKERRTEKGKGEKGN